MCPIPVKILFLGFIFLSFNCFALPEDKNEIIHVRADSADLSNEKHHGIYRGHVELDQGSTHVRALEAITTGNEKNELIKAEAIGDELTLAHYWTLTSTDKPPLHAFARKIVYYPTKYLIVMMGNAKVSQGNDSFSAPLIRFDTKSQRIMTEHTQNERTVIIIHPEKK